LRTRTTLHQIEDVAKRRICGALRDCSPLRRRELSLEAIEQAIEHEALTIVDGRISMRLPEARFLQHPSERVGASLLPIPCDQIQLIFARVQRRPGPVPGVGIATCSRHLLDAMGHRTMTAALVLALVAGLGIDAAAQARGGRAGGGGRGGRGGGAIPPLLMQTDAFEDGGIIPVCRPWRQRPARICVFEYPCRHGELRDHLP
jgi:hypothetical protein